MIVPVGSFHSSVDYIRRHSSEFRNLYINCRELLHSRINLLRHLYVFERRISPELRL